MASSTYSAFLTAETVKGCAQRSCTAGIRSGPGTVCIKLTVIDQTAEMLLLLHCCDFELFPNTPLTLCLAGHSLSSMNTRGITRASPAPCATTPDLSTLLKVGSTPGLPSTWVVVSSFSHTRSLLGTEWWWKVMQIKKRNNAPAGRWCWAVFGLDSLSTLQAVRLKSWIGLPGICQGAVCMSSVIS